MATEEALSLSEAAAMFDKQFPSLSRGVEGPRHPPSQKRRGRDVDTPQEKEKTDQKAHGSGPLPCEDDVDVQIDVVEHEVNDPSCGRALKTRREVPMKTAVQEVEGATVELKRNRHEDQMREGYFLLLHLSE